MLLRLNSVFLTVLAGALIAFGQDRPPVSAVDSVLSRWGMNSADMVSDRAWAEDDTFLLPRIREALRSPLVAHRVTREFSEAVPTAVADAGSVNRMAEFLAASCPEVVCRDIDAQLAAARPTALDPFEPMLSAFALAEGYRVQAFSALSPAKQHELLTALPLWFEDEEVAADDTLRGMLQRALGLPLDTAFKADADSVLTMLSLVKRDALSAATYALARGLALAVESWKATKSPFSVTMTPGADGLVLAVRDTPYGKFVLGGSGPNVYSGDFALIIDLGGDDQYTTRVACGIGGLSRSIGVVLDMSGNDLYRMEKVATLACGVLGIGALADLGGNDLYVSGAFSQGSSFCGAGLFFDASGDDVYRAGLFSQAAAVCGVSVLVDGGGDDLYDVAEYGQGYASTFAASALVDRGGNDAYRAGGLDLHVPLRPEDYRSLSQGFAIGARPRGGGGFALLHDLSGNDFYDAEIYAQGVGYWYSLGALLDDAGNDAYNATQYAQGAGIHLAAGVLEDAAGDDRYGSRFGPGQGGAHDLSVGFLWDRGGDDQYVMSGGQGMAITNSAALMIDELGNDSYFTSEPGLGQGGSRESRGFGSVGVFVDREGKDVYSSPDKQDSAVWMQGLFGIGEDLPWDSLKPREAPVETALVPKDTLRSIEDLFRDAARWEVTDNRQIVRRAREALKAKGIVAVEWVTNHKLNTLDGLEQRAIIELCKVYPDSAALFLYRALDTGDFPTRRNAIVILGEMKYRPAARVLTERATRSEFGKLRRHVLTALGEIGDTTATGLCMQYAGSSLERERIAAVVALGKLAEPRGWSILFKSLSDPMYTVRSAAIIALGSQGADVLPRLKDELASAEPPQIELLLVAAGRMANRWHGDEKMKTQIGKLTTLIRKYADYPEPRVQATALAAGVEIMPRRDVDKLIARLNSSQDVVVLARVREAEQKLR